MALESKLELRLTQKLILTPQLQQSIKLLQAPQLELSEILTQEMLENPFLEEVLDEEAEENIESPEMMMEEKIHEETGEDIDLPLERIFSFRTDEYFEERACDGRDLGYFTNDIETTYPLEGNTRKPNLYEYLLWQLRLSPRSSEPISQVAEVIIGNLNEDGYLQVSIEEIAEISQVDTATAMDALTLIHGFDPPGVGARNLQECLILQLKSLNLEGTLVEKILTHGFEELAGKRYKQLATRFKTSLQNILDAVKIIEGLEPRPGRNYSNEDPPHIIPDVYVEESEGKFIITLNDEGIPRVRLSNHYRRLLSYKNNLSSEEKSFLKEKLRSAIWLLKSLDQRKKTIYRITESILKFQEDFFRKGIKYLKPLTLRDVATDLGIHESTVSRVTSNKYLQCQRGLFNFKFFFSNPVPLRGDISSASVKEIIKEAIAREDPKLPLHDKHLVEILRSKNINVALRTVAKYREGLKILSYSKRKKWF